jgi:hypothetical protein
MRSKSLKPTEASLNVSSCFHVLGDKVNKELCIVRLKLFIIHTFREVMAVMAFLMCVKNGGKGKPETS